MYDDLTDEQEDLLFNMHHDEPELNEVTIIITINKEREDE
jgi:hypothetical protein